MGDNFQRKQIIVMMLIDLGFRDVSHQSFDDPQSMFQKNSDDTNLLFKILSDDNTYLLTDGRATVDQIYSAGTITSVDELKRILLGHSGNLLNL